MSKAIQLKDNSGYIFPKGYNAIMTLSLTGRPTYNAPTDWFTGIINLNNIVSYFGNSLTKTSDGGIKIGKGVSMIEVSGAITYFTSSNTGETNCSIIRLRGTNKATATRCFDMKTRAIYTVSNTPVVYPVQEGDIIYLYYDVQQAGNYAFLGDGVGTFLTVKVIN